MTRLIRRSLAEFIGVMVFTASVVGVHTAVTLSSLAGLATATVLGLMTLLTLNVSGGHLNPAVSLYFLARRQISVSYFFSYLVAQLLAALAGAWLGGFVWGASNLAIVPAQEALGGAFASEVLATAVLVTLFGYLSANKKSQLIPVAVAAWTFAAGVFTVTGAIANPALTFGRLFTPNTQVNLSFNVAANYLMAQLLGVLLAVIVTSFILGKASLKKAFTISFTSKARAAAKKKGSKKQMALKTVSKAIKPKGLKPAVQSSKKR